MKSMAANSFAWLSSYFYFRFWRMLSFTGSVETF